MDEAIVHQRGSRHSSPSPAIPLKRDDPHYIDSYEVLGRLGSGGMGIVYLCRSSTHHLVAVKMVHPHLAADKEFRSRFSSEAQAGRKVPPFCAAKVLDVGSYNSRPYLVTEYIDGIPLSELIAQSGSLDIPDLHALALGMAAGLSAIHSVGLVHRDVKPSNIMMTLGGVRIIDFGIARALEETSGYTRTGIVMGSLGWAAPEQLDGARPSPAMDIFSWGCVLGYAASGHHPFGEGGPNTKAWRIMNSSPDVSAIQEPLRSIVASALNHFPHKRPNAQQLLLSLINAGATHSPRQPLFSRPGYRKAAGAFAAAIPLAVAFIVSTAEATNSDNKIMNRQYQSGYSDTVTTSGSPTKANSPTHATDISQKTKTTPTSRSGVAPSTTTREQGLGESPPQQTITASTASSPQPSPTGSNSKKDKKKKDKKDKKP